MPGIMVDEFRIASSSMYAEVRSVCEKAVGGNRSELAPSYSDVKKKATNDSPILGKVYHHYA
jgi:hypothetical protein